MGIAGQGSAFWGFEAASNPCVAAVPLGCSPRELARECRRWAAKAGRRNASPRAATQGSKQFSSKPFEEIRSTIWRPWGSWKQGTRSANRPLLTMDAAMSQQAALSCRIGSRQLANGLLSSRASLSQRGLKTRHSKGETLRLASRREDRQHVRVTATLAAEAPGMSRTLHHRSPIDSMMWGK